MDNAFYLMLKSDSKVSCQNDSILVSRESYPTIQLYGLNVIFFYCICNNMSNEETITYIVSGLSAKATVVEEQLLNFIELLDHFFDVSVHKSNNVPISLTTVKEILGNKKHNARIVQRSTVPETISLSITSCCQMECIYCYANAVRADRNVSAIVSLDRFQQLVDEAVKIGVKSFELSGGDPFCVSNIDEYIEILIKSGIDWNISTKGYISQAHALHLKEIGLNKLQVSLDSSDKKTVELLTNRSDGFDIISSTIRNLVSANIDVRVKAVITSKNILEIPDFISFLENEGVNEVGFSWYGSLCGRPDLSLYPSREDILWLNAYMEFADDNRAISIDYVKLNEDFFTFLEKPLSYKHSFRKKCGASRYRMSIDERGDVYFCEYMLREPELKIGSIFNQSIVDLWNCDKMQSLLYPQVQNFKNSNCFDCEVFNSCYDRRCFLRSKHRYGTIFDKDPWCKYGDADFDEY